MLSIFPASSRALVRASPLDLLSEFPDWDAFHSLPLHHPRTLSLHHPSPSPLKALHSSLPQLSATEDGYLVQLQTPGVPQEQLDLQVVGRRRLELNVNLQSSSGPSSLSRQTSQQVDLPHDADVDAISVSYKDGLLTVKVPKKPQQQDASHTVSMDLDAEHPELVEDLASKKRRVQELQTSLKEERASLDEAERKLGEARREARRKLASERRQIKIDAKAIEAKSSEAESGPSQPQS